MVCPCGFLPLPPQFGGSGRSGGGRKGGTLWPLSTSCFRGDPARGGESSLGPNSAEELSLPARNVGCCHSGEGRECGPWLRLRAAMQEAAWQVSAPFSFLGHNFSSRVCVCSFPLRSRCHHRPVSGFCSAS